MIPALTTYLCYNCKNSNGESVPRRNFRRAGFKFSFVCFQSVVVDRSEDMKTKYFATLVSLKLKATLTNTRPWHGGRVVKGDIHQTILYFSQKSEFEIFDNYKCKNSLTYKESHTVPQMNYQLNRFPDLPPANLFT